MVVAAALLMMAMKQAAGGLREGAKGKQPGAGRLKERRLYTVVEQEEDEWADSVGALLCFNTIRRDTKVMRASRFCFNQPRDVVTTSSSF